MKPNLWSPAIPLMMLAILVSGCATEKRRTEETDHRERAQLRERAEEEARLKAYQEEDERMLREHSALVARAEGKGPTREEPGPPPVDSERRRKATQTKRWVENNKKALAEKLTDIYLPRRQEFLNAVQMSGIPMQVNEGTAFALEVQNVSFERSSPNSDEFVFVVYPTVWWKSSDGTGGWARISVKYDPVKGTPEQFATKEVKLLTRSELAEVLKPQPGAVPQETPKAGLETTPSQPAQSEASAAGKWEISNETFNAGLQTVLSIAGAWIVHSISGH